MAYKIQPLDKIDVRILEHIRDNPGCGIGDVIRETKEYGLQNTTIRYRVKKLSGQGLIRLDKALERYYLLYHTDKAVRFLMHAEDQLKMKGNEEGDTSPKRSLKGISPSSGHPNLQETEAIR